LKILSRSIRYHLPPVLWALIILISMSIPAEYIPKVKIFGYDKIAHIGVFMVFGILVYRSIINWQLKNINILRSILFSLFSVMFFGFFSEAYQQFIPGRTPDIYDFIADTIGGLIAIPIILIYNLYKSKKLLQVENN
jgi:VanZ family protein